jgi:hypothetical protein
MLEKLMKSIFKETCKMIIKTHGADASKLTDYHFDNLWKISESTEGTERDKKLQEYLETYVL